jgi:hypothetical protein
MQDAIAVERPLIGGVFADFRHTRPFALTVRYGSMVQIGRFYTRADAHAARQDLLAATVGMVSVCHGGECQTHSGHALADEYPLLLYIAAQLAPDESRALATCTGTPVIVKRLS